jgi:N-dimethylarginine dimethylaminohydrolase
MQEQAVVLDGVADVQELSLGEIPTRPPHTTAVLVEPRFFDREYVINPYMDGDVDRARAREQWEELRDIYERRADDVRVLDPADTWEMLDAEEGPPPDERPDMVFVANHGVPTADGSGIVLARMATDERAGEPDHFRVWANEHDYSTEPAPSVRFEGMGDALWHPNRRLLWGGYGVRSDRRAYDELAERLDATIIPLELTDEHYYHLDVCLAPLSESTALIQPEAFTSDGLDKINAVFETVLEAPAAESTDGLAVNLEVIDDTVIMGSGAPETTALLEDAGYDVLSVETDEFLKAGGSVCCLTLSVGTPAEP